MSKQLTKLNPYERKVQIQQLDVEPFQGSIC